MKAQGVVLNKVVIIWTGFNPSTVEKCHLMTQGLEAAGVKTHSIGFSDTLEKRKHFEEVYAHEANYSYEYGLNRTLYQGGNYVAKIMNNIFMSAFFFYRLLLYFSKEKVSSIIIPPQPIEVTFPAIILGKLFSVNVVPNIMEFYPAMPSYKKKKNILIRWSWKLVINNSDAFIVISNFLFEKIGKLSNKKIMRLPAILPDLAADLNNFSEITAYDKPLLVYTSSSGYEELLKFTLESLGYLINHDFEFVITGKYSNESQRVWFEKINTLGLSDKVKFSGFLSDNDLMLLQKKSDALLIPLVDNDRHKARFPQKVLSYMRLGKPVITTYVGEPALYFEDGDTVIMDKSVTARGFSDKILLVLENPHLARDIGLRGKKYVENRFDMTMLGRELKDFLCSI